MNTETENVVFSAIIANLSALTEALTRIEDRQAKMEATLEAFAKQAASGTYSTKTYGPARTVGKAQSKTITILQADGNTRVETLKPAQHPTLKAGERLVPNS